MLMEYIQRWQAALQTAMFSSLFCKQDFRERLQQEKKEKKKSALPRLEVRNALCLEEGQSTDEDMEFSFAWRAFSFKKW